MLNLELLGRAATDLETQAQEHYDRSALNQRRSWRHDKDRDFDEYIRLHRLAAGLWEEIRRRDV